MSTIKLNTGSQTVEYQIPDGKWVQGQYESKSPALPDLLHAVAEQLESPLDFPALRSALTPDDHLVIVFRDSMNGAVQALQAVLEHIQQAGVQMEQVIVLMPSLPSQQEPIWKQQLPAHCQGFQLEYHDPATSKMAYLASTKAGRRIYLNRHVVDADQIIILSNVRFDAIYGIACGLADVFPVLSDVPTRTELNRVFHSHVPDLKHSFPIWGEAEEVGWQLGMPFVVCLAEGIGTAVNQVFAGNAAAVRKQADNWLRKHATYRLPYQVDLVVITLTGTPDQQDFTSIAEAAIHASRIVHQGGRIAILSEVSGVLPQGSEIFSAAETAVAGLSQLRHQPEVDRLPWWQLATSLEQATVYLFSHLSQEVTEALFITPLDNPGQVGQLMEQAKTVAIVEGGNRTLMELSKSPS